MASIQVLRIESRNGLDSALLAHVNGRARPETATEVENPVVVFERDVKGAREAIKQVSALKRRGRRPKPMMELMVAGPPPFESPDRWSEDRNEAWVSDSLEWLHRKFPGATIAVAAHHRDETSPHMHVLFAPTTTWGELHWGKALGEATGIPYERNRLVASRQMAALQESYFDEVCRQHGLGRGEPKSKKRHEVIDRLKAVEATERSLAARQRVVEGKDQELSEGIAEVQAVKDENAERARQLKADQELARRARQAAEEALETARQESEEVETKSRAVRAEEEAAASRRNAVEADLREDQDALATEKTAIQKSRKADVESLASQKADFQRWRNAEAEALKKKESELERDRKHLREGEAALAVQTKAVREAADWLKKRLIGLGRFLVQRAENREGIWQALGRAIKALGGVLDNEAQGQLSQAVEGGMWATPRKELELEGPLRPVPAMRDSERFRKPEWWWLPQELLAEPDDPVVAKVLTVELDLGPSETSHAKSQQRSKDTYRGR